MKKKKFLLLIIFLFIINLRPVNAAVANSFAGGNGTSGNPYQISNADELALLANYINNSSTNGTYTSKYYVLTNDIDLFEYSNWTPIGFGNGVNFKGNFDGQGHIIKNMNINISTLDSSYKLSYGLFGAANTNSLISNVELVDSNISINLTTHKASTKDLDIGMLIGHIDGNASVINCIVRDSNIHVYDTFELGNAIALKIGGLIGDAGETSTTIRNMKMENLFSNVDITVDDSEWPVNSNTNRYYQFVIGGIVGRLRRAQYFPKNCIYKGTITSKYAFIGPIFASYRYTEGSTFAEFSKMYIGYSTLNNTFDFDNDSNLFYNYVVNGVEIGENYKTDLYSRNVLDNAGNNITVYTLGNNLPYSNEYYMKNYQGVNRGNYVENLSSTSSMYNGYATREVQYNCTSWFYSSYADTYSFRQDSRSVELVEIGENKYEARMLNNEDITYKWYIDNVLQSESSNIITIDMPLTDIRLRVEIYSDDNKVGSVEKIIEEYKLLVSLVREEENGLETYRVNYDNVTSDSPIIDNYSFVWYEIVKNEETQTYENILLPCTDDNWITTKSSYGYRVLLINKNYNKYNKELLYVNDDIKYVFVSFENSEFENGMYYKMGDDNNTGDSPEHAVKTITRAYELLNNNGAYDKQIIIIIGRYLGEYKSVSYSGNKNGAIYTKPASITGSFLGNNYYGNFYIDISNYLNATTSFDSMTISTYDASDHFIYAQGNDLYMGENMTMKVLGYSTTVLTGTSAPAFNIVAGFLNYNNNNHINSEICHIVVKSGYYARILGGNRNSGNYDNYKNHGLAFTPDNPFNVIIDIDMENETNPDNYDYDVNLLVGAQTDGSSYTNVVINILNGNIGRVIGGTQGYGHTTSDNYPVDSFFGSVTTNIINGTIGQLYSGSLGRNNPTSYFYGKMITNISGGIIHENIFGSGAGGVSGFSNDASLYDETFDVVKNLVTGVTMIDIDGNTYRLDKATSTINISGGVIEGSVYGGGYGYSTMLPEAENIAVDGGSLYGDVFVNISGGVIEGSVYGGGKGTDMYGSDRTELANVYGNVSVNISGNTTINGNIYGGSEGLHDYPDMAKVNGDINLEINGQNLVFDGNIYGGSNAGQVEGDITLNINNINTSGKIFGGGNAGNVYGSVDATIDSINALELYGGGDSGIILGSVDLDISNSIFTRNIYGGCNSGDVYQTVSLDITESEAQEIYGGGLSGNISEYVTSTEAVDEIEGREALVTSSVIVNSGEYENIFGGGNLGKVFGDTYVKVGTTTTYTEVSGVVYGGGRGTGAEFETVSGSSNVLITGKDTRINNYGSTKLGKVVGDVYLIFKDYYVNNPTNRYKVMNGIDRATTVTFNNSYVLLENIVDGELKGIEDIENIVLPNGSGLKISADGHITGDFSGGGKLYLDSAVCMTVDGDISGSTTLVLNPKLADSNTSTILGKIDNPYMIVKGSSEATSEEEAATSLVSAPGEEYTILTQKSELTNNYTYYYIADTIAVNDFINQTAINTKDKKFTSIFNETDDITILNNRSFTSAINITMSFLDDGSKGNKYKDIYKTITLVDGLDNNVTIPSGTKIYMIFGSTYYYYDVLSDTNEINLGLFTSFQGDTFDNEFSIEDVDSAYYKENMLSKLYTYPEDYRFVFDFSKSDNLISDTVCVKLNIIDNGELQELNNHQTNMVKFLNRDYDITTTFDATNVVNFNNLSVNTNIKISALPKGSIINPEYFGMRITLFDEDDNIINIPNNTEVIIGDNIYAVKNGIISIKLSDTPVSINAVNKDIQFSMDVSNVLPQDKLENGNYKLRFGYGLFKNDIMEDIIKQEDILDFSVDNFLLNDYIANYGLKATMVSDNNVPIEKRQIDKEKIIDYGNIENRTIKIEYNSSIDEGRIEITAMKKDDNSFEYHECEGITFNTDMINLDYVYDMNRNITATFEDTLEKGFYRVYVTLYNKIGEKVTSDYVNFLVYDK